MRKFDIVTIGNAIIDLFLLVHDANLSMRVNKESSEFCLKAGEKIEVDRCDLMIGGNATNAAVGLARAGFSASLIAEVGDDEFADRITKTLSKERVDTSNVIRTKNAASSMTVGINFQGERTLFVEHVKRAHNFIFDDIETQWVYLTSLGNEWKMAYQRVVEFVEKKKALLAFNPGTIQVQAGYTAIADALRVTDILFVNKEEAAKILSIKYKISSIKELLVGLQKLGPKVAVITDGKNGSYALDQDGNIYSLGVFPTSDVVEKTGAGDAYASGFMSAILKGVGVKEAMRWGTVSAASVIEKTGAQQGLLTREEIMQKLQSGIQ